MLVCKAYLCSDGVTCPEPNLKNAKLLISFLGTLEMCPKSKLNFEIIYFVLREQREGANSEIKKGGNNKKNIIGPPPGSI